MNAPIAALDTNVLVYAEGLNGEERRREVLALLRRLPEESVVLPVQAMGELFHVLTRKGGHSSEEARRRVLAWADGFDTVETSARVMISATEIAARSNVAIWDAVMLAAAAEAGCRLLLSEDMQDGFTWAGVTIVNPFASPQNPLLAALLA